MSDKVLFPPPSAPRVQLTLDKDPSQGLLELLLGLLQPLLMSCLLVDQAADMVIGRLDHGIEVVGTSPVHLTTLYPGQQCVHCFRECGII